MGSEDKSVKVLHGLGSAVLLLSEYWRSVIDGLRPGAAPPDRVQALARAAASMADNGLHKTAADLFETASFGQERAALWAAVCCALVVRLNRHGSPELQKALSYVSAAYCTLAVLVGMYYLFASGPIVLLALGIGLGVMHTATRT
ncbi:hypothetical protein B4N89_44605 [Embleya scabrispora]|uniref:Uncharacterized protein n=1 Tax=Embleya scabrispora TaxID=159449 RepID=A0A1T3NLC6_9ACTN|nr:hypothetical protein B4N89_44605 [Embleya scabrispora]